MSCLEQTLGLFDDVVSPVSVGTVAFDHLIPGKLAIVPVSQKQANAHIRAHHRHHGPVAGWKFGAGLALDGQLIGVFVAGRPSSRNLDNGTFLEVTRICTEGIPNSCSMLTGACRRAATALGYERLYTYTLPHEGGASLKAAGWEFDGEAGGGSWSQQSRPRTDDHPTDVKWRWRIVLRPKTLEMGTKPPNKADSATPESAPVPAKNPPAPTVEDPPKAPSQQGREAT